MEKKPALSFGFSKVKPKSTLAKNDSEAFREYKKRNEEEKIEIITSIEGNRLTPLNGQSSDASKKPLVIPCQKNQLIVGEKKSQLEKVLDQKETTASKSDDLEAVRELLKDTKRKNEEKEKQANMKIELNAEKAKVEEIEEPNYEAIDLEQFGKAALRGMGWNEKEGIGLTNKRTFAFVEPELRPKGLGLGAGFNKKKERSSNEQEEESGGLKFVKGAFVQILSGKYRDDIGQIVSFDDGLNRVLVKLAISDQNVSVIQSYTKLISKSEYESLAKKKAH
jgi:hypothetical protein